MPSPRTMQWARRISQTLFLLLFLWLLLATFYHGVVQEGDVFSDRLPYPVSLFLQIDPLAAVSTFLSTGTVYEDLLLALCVLIPTFFLGRWFCGWVCPFGTIHNAFSEGFRKRTALKIQRNRASPLQAVKYGVLLFLLGSALCGTLLIGLLDPLCFLIRSLGLSILPALDRVLRGAIGWLPGEGALEDGLYRFLDDHFLGADPYRFHGGWLLGSLLILVVALNLYMPRFWCRVLCPLGALLGLAAKFTLFGLHRKEEGCKECGLCLKACQGAASPEHGVKWKPTECFVCYNCVTTCPQGTLDFKFGVQKENTDSTTDLSRRGFVASCALGAAAFPLIRASHDPMRESIPTAIRPPGACEEGEFLARCIRCGQCMKVCPNNAIHPATYHAGFEGFWSPVIIPRIGYCEPTCTLCSQACPTGAIRAFTAEDKKANRVRIGTAFFDRGRCLPWAMARTCMQCEEFCPTSPKAIWFEQREVLRPDGSMVEVGLPHVDPEVCTGCGACETVCPVADQAAIRVTSVGESRSEVNRFLLLEDGPQRDGLHGGGLEEDVLRGDGTPR